MVLKVISKELYSYVTTQRVISSLFSFAITSKKRPLFNSHFKPTLYRKKYISVAVDANTFFDFIEHGKRDEYELHLRVVRIKIKDEIYENLITNLSHEEFSVNDLKKLYHLRWNEEILRNRSSRCWLI